MTRSSPDRRRSAARASLRGALTLLAVAWVGCQEEEALIEPVAEQERETADAVEVSEPGALRDLPEVPANGPGGELCMRARLCCEAYVATVATRSDEVEWPDGGDCDAVVPAQAEDPRGVCRNKIRTWASALVAANVEVPPHCDPVPL